MTIVSAQQLEACLALATSSSPLGDRVKEALDVVYDILDTYGEDHVSLSFNGGKDCTVLLHLYAAALHHRRQTTPRQTEAAPTTNGLKPTPISPAYSIPSIYIAPPSPFDELEAFISACEQRYHLSLFRTTTPPTASTDKGGDSMKHALETYKTQFPDIEAIFVGVRRGDPHGGKLAYKNPTDGDWPRFMRVHPIINWSYSEIWTFLRQLDVSYCDLYDIGYTSLGSTYNTFPNPALRRARSSYDQKTSYLPAYELLDEALERAGRGQKTHLTVEVPSSELPTPSMELTSPTMA
ncbi:adenine nucleotide alpha hydrolases-like protein [Ramaria rubella]|nr:adenine nucleotide alpha hydrolases-like protein [Ramaria rubella]